MSDAIREEDEGSDNDEPRERRAHRAQHDSTPTVDTKDQLWKSQMELLNQQHQL